MNTFHIIFLLLLACAANASGFPFSKSSSDTAAGDTIAGDLPAVIMPKKHPYFVAGDIYVPQGKTVTISAGTIFCFKNFTGLHIMGTLLAKGAKDLPVVFTSENDRDYNKNSTVGAAPYDWNGIYIHEDGIGTQLSFCAVLYSVDGVSALTKFIKLAPCLFMHNGRANLTIEGTPQQVTDQPYEYSLSVNDVSAAGGPVSALKDPLALSRKTIRYSGGTAAAAGCIAAIVCAVQLGSSQRTLSSISSTEKTNLAKNSSETWLAARTDKHRDIAGLLSSIGVAAIGAIGIYWSFRF
jgi:hypothetical protein